MKIMLTRIMLCLMLVAAPAWALDLDTAKNEGLVGETPTGYLEAVGSADGATPGLIKNINAKRRAEYEKIAKQRNVDLKAVEKLAGETAINKTRPGNYVKINGKWIKK